MKKTLLILSLLVYGEISFSQKQTNFWYFSQNAGLDFSSGTPAPITNGALFTNEGSSSISDAAGNLLFYTDGISVWNKNNVVMPAGTGLLGDISTTQSALIIPKPGSTNLFYILTLPAEGGGNFCYSIVDMSLQAGLGDVTTKNTVLKSSVTEKLSAVHHCNGTDIWVMVHEWNTNQFAAYLVTASGISAPVISNSGPVQGDVHGQMKFNTNGTAVVCARDTVIDGNAATYQGKAFLDLFAFDNTTGIVSNPRLLSFPNHQKTYGVEFSPDNSKLYAAYYDITGINGGNSSAVQFDLSATNIQASMTILSTSFDPQILRSFQLGPDGKIYIAKSNGPFVCVINSPNTAGVACNYTDNAINIDPGSIGAMCMLGLPNFIQSYFNPTFPNITCVPAVTAVFESSDTVFCKNNCINFTDLSTGSPTSWNWSFPGATPSSSNAQNPTNICYGTPGVHTVKLIVSNGTNSDTATEQITVNSAVISAGPDITIAPGASALLSATGSTAGYTWSPSASLSSPTGATVTATPSVTTTYVVSGSSNNCPASDTVIVSVEINCSGEVFVPTAFSPNGNGHNETECVMGNCVQSMFFAIYDRWGEKVFESTDQKLCWDGNFKGKQMDSGIFVYYLKATLYNGKEIAQKGNITLIR